MERKKSILRAHVLVFPFPAQGHINPMLQFSKRLASRGLKVTLVTTIFISKSMYAQAGSVKVEPISDGFDDGFTKEKGSFDVYQERFEAVGSRTLAELVERLGHCGNPVTCLVYDSLLIWTLDVAKRLGLASASFFTQTGAANAIYYHFQRGNLSTPIQGTMISVPGLPFLGVSELPSFVYAPGSYPFLLNLVLKQFSNFEKADWLLFNTFDKLEEEIVKWMAKQWRMVKTIGPTLPSMYLEKQIEDDKAYGLDIFKPNSDDCTKWLSSKGAGSIVYVSYGSYAILSEEQIKELAWGLKRTNSYFLWVVRESEQNKLPSNFKEETSEKGLVVTWCSQTQVLAHNSVGCFVTHCGWNSTLEAISLGVPMVAMPQWADQTINAKFIVDVWKVGLKVKVDDKGIVRREEIELCINEVMEGKKGKEIGRNAIRWKELAKEAIDEGGSSDRNIEEFVAAVTSV